LTVDACAVQAQSFECLNGSHTPAVFLVTSFTAKGVCVDEHVQNLNLKGA